MCYDVNQWKKYVLDVLELEEKQLMEEHLLNCDNCLELYLMQLEKLDSSNVNIPDDFTDKLMTQIVHPSSSKQKANNNLILYYYIAASLTIFFIFSGFFNNIITYTNKTENMIVSTASKLRELEEQRMIKKYIIDELKRSD